MINNMLDKKKINKMLEGFKQKPFKQKTHTDFLYYKKLANNKTYGIVCENSKYYIKYSDKPYKDSSKYEYLGEGMFYKYAQNSYIEAQRLLEEIDITLLKEKRYVIKKKVATSNPIEPSDSVGDTNFTDDIENDDSILDEPSTDEPQDDMEGMDGSDISDEDIEDEEDPKKKIQKLSGKLGYEMRQYDGEDYSSTAKYAMSSVASAIDGDRVDSEDEKGILNKVEKALTDNDNAEEAEVETDETEIDDEVNMEESVNRYTGYFIQNPKEVFNYLKPRHSDIKCTHVVVEDNVEEINENSLGKELEFKAVGRVINEKCDVLLVSGVDSQYTPHIIISSNGNVSNEYVNEVIKHAQENKKVIKVNPFKLYGKFGWGNSNGDILYSVNEKFFLRNNLYSLTEGTLNGWVTNMVTKCVAGVISEEVVKDAFASLLKNLNINPSKELFEAHLKTINFEGGINLLKESKEKQDFNNLLFEEVSDGTYTEKPPKNKNTKFRQKWFGDMHIGRYEGDDDAVEETDGEFIKRIKMYYDK